MLRQKQQQSLKPKKIAIVSYCDDYNNIYAHKQVPCLIANKRWYAEQHDYLFLGHRVDENNMDLIPHYSFMTPNKQKRYDKLRMLLYHMEQHIVDEVEWFLWMDCDAWFENMQIDLMERIQLWTDMHEKKKKEKNLPLTLVIGVDMNLENTGVFLIRNTATGRHMLSAIYSTYTDPKDNWADNRSFVTYLKSFADKDDFVSQSVLTLTGTDFRLLQSYVTTEEQSNKNPKWDYDDGDFIIHLPGHGWTVKNKIMDEHKLCSLGHGQETTRM